MQPLLQQRFRGLLMGAAIAESLASGIGASGIGASGIGAAGTGNVASLQILAHLLAYEFWDCQGFPQGDESLPSRQDLRWPVIQTCLWTLITHDCPVWRQQRIQQIAAAYSVSASGLQRFSYLLSRRLLGQSISPADLLSPILPKESPPAKTLFQTVLQGLTQRTDLRTAETLIHQAQGLEDLDRAIALACYCWISSPHLFSQALARSCTVGAQPLVPLLTGALAGVSVGQAHIPCLVHSPFLAQIRLSALPQPPLADSPLDQLCRSADYLFYRWAGHGQTPSDPQPLEPVITAPGQLRPRDLQLSLQDWF